MLNDYTTYQFEPIYITLLFVIWSGSPFLFYVAYHGLIPMLPLALITISPFAIGWMVLPNFFRFLRRSPAMELTASHLIDDVNGLSIAWNDISALYTTKAMMSSGALVIRLRNPKTYAKPRPGLFAYQLRRSSKKNEVKIYFDLIHGKNQDIFEMVNSYWQRHRDVSSENPFHESYEGFGNS